MLVFVAMSWSCLNLSVVFLGGSLCFFILHMLYSHIALCSYVTGVCLRSHWIWCHAWIPTILCWFGGRSPCSTWRYCPGSWKHNSFCHEKQYLLPKKPEGAAVSTSSLAAGAARPGQALPCSCWWAAALRPQGHLTASSGTEPKSLKETRKDDLESNWPPGSYLLQSYKCHGGRALRRASGPSWHPSKGLPPARLHHNLDLAAKLSPWHSSCCIPCRHAWVWTCRWIC